jgi:predicted kinase
MPRVYILCGLPFAGKTTLARALAQHLDLPRVSIDEINGERGLGFDNAPIASEDWDITYAESYRQLDKHLRAGCSVIYDAANFTRAERDKARAVAAQSGSDTCVIYVTTPKPLVRQRWLLNRLTHKRNDIRDDYFANVITQFEPPTEDENVLPYSNEQGVDEWIEQSSL